MKYFNPNYWFKLWLLSAPLFNDETKGINAMSINNNKKIKSWASKNTTNISLLENQELTLSNNQTTLLNLPLWNSNLTTHNQHNQKSRNRYKRRPIPPSKEIFQLSEKLIINQNNPNQYRNSFQSILESLTNNNILRIVFDDSENRNWGENSRIFSLNSQNYGYFRLPVQIIQEQNGQSNQINLELVLSTDALYIQGFIINHHDTGAHTPNIETYYYFNPDLGTPSGRYNPQLREVTGITNSVMLIQIGNAYRHLIPTENNNINWETIYNSFLRLTHDINVDIERPLGNLARALGQVIFVTAEAIRFPNIYARIVSHLITRNENINLESNQRNEIYTILVNWGTSSRDSIFRWLLQIANIIQNNPNMMISPPSMIDFTRALSSPAVQVVLGYIEFQRLRNNRRNANCRRGKRELKNTYWHEKFCDLKPQIEKIHGKITAIKILDENTKSGNLKEGTIYVGTENGFYIIYPDGQVHRFDNLDFSIKDIILDGNGSAYVTNDNCEIYHLNLVNWGSEKLKNMESCDLNKELKIYYDNSKNDREFSKTYTGDGKISIPIVRILEGGGIGGAVGAAAGAVFGSVIAGSGTVIGAAGAGAIGATIGIGTAWWTFGDYINNKNQESKDFYINLLKGVNPFDYKKIEILYENFDNIYTKASRGDEEFYSEKITNCIKGNIKSEFNCKLMDITETNFYSLQNFKLKFYKHITHWTIQIHKTQFAKNNAWLFANNGGMWMGVGNGIRLYNDDESIRTKRDIFDIDNLKEKNELKNLTKWTNEFRKNINYEQHLSIDNKTNFVTNNITSL